MFKKLSKQGNSSSCHPQEQTLPVSHPQEQALAACHPQERSDVGDPASHAVRVKRGLGIFLKPVIKSLKVAIISLFLTSSFAQPVFTPEQQQAIEQIVANYLQKHPAAPPKAVTQDNADPVIAHSDTLFHDPDSPSVTYPQADAVIVEFFDYQCGHCKGMRYVFDQLLKKTHRVKLIFKELPLFGEQSLFAAKAALAAARQGRYWELHQAMLVSDGGLPPEHVLDLARELGLNMEQLSKDMNDPAIMAELNKNAALAKALRVEGTPALFLSDTGLHRIELIPGEVSTENLIRSINEVISPDKPKIDG